MAQRRSRVGPHRPPPPIGQIDSSPNETSASHHAPLERGGQGGLELWGRNRDRLVPAIRLTAGSRDNDLPLGWLARPLRRGDGQKGPSALVCGFLRIPEPANPRRLIRMILHPTESKGLLRRGPSSSLSHYLKAFRSPALRSVLREVVVNQRPTLFYWKEHPCDPYSSRPWGQSQTRARWARSTSGSTID